MRNRATTYESLKAFVIVLTTQDKDAYIEAYKKATHDNFGKYSWGTLTQAYKKNQKEKRSKG